MGGERHQELRVSVESPSLVLAQLWEKEGQDAPHVLAHIPGDARHDETIAYAGYVSNLLGARLRYLTGETALNTLIEEAKHGYELVISLAAIVAGVLLFSLASRFLPIFQDVEDVEAERSPSEGRSDERVWGRLPHARTVDGS
jgi:hypothetical protein